MYYCMYTNGNSDGDSRSTPVLHTAKKQNAQQDAKKMRRK